MTELRDYQTKPYGDEFVAVSQSQPNEYLGDDEAMWLFHNRADADWHARAANTPTRGERMDAAVRGAFTRMFRGGKQ